MWITIISYFDRSHVCIAFQCIHAYMSLLRLHVWRTNVFGGNCRHKIRTMVHVQIAKWKYTRNRRMRI